MYIGKVPCCGIFCGNCPNYIRDDNKCFGAESYCKKRKCGINMEQKNFYKIIIVIQNTIKNNNTYQKKSKLLSA